MNVSASGPGFKPNRLRLSPASNQAASRALSTWNHDQSRRFFSPHGPIATTIWFTADTHFGDHRTINIHKRPFASVAEMDALLIENWNRRVAPDDIVWHLGDFARQGARVPALLAELNGIKHLVRGNNDPDESAAAPGWQSVGDYAELEVDARRLILCHYPFRSWNGQHRGAIDLHGHSHGKLKPLPRQFDVGVDARQFAPVTLAELIG